MRAVRFRKGCPPYNAREVAAFSDEKAAGLVQDGVAEYLTPASQASGPTLVRESAEQVEAQQVETTGLETAAPSSGDASQQAPEGAALALPEGYRVEEVHGGWLKVYGPDGEQVGKSVRSEAEALEAAQAHAGPQA